MKSGIKYIINQGKEGFIPEGVDGTYYLDAADKIIEKYQKAIEHQSEMLNKARSILKIKQGK